VGLNMKHLKILNSTLDGIIVANRNGKIEFANNSVTRMLGYTESELFGQPIEMMIPKTFRHAHVAHRNGYMTKPATRMMNQNRRFSAVKKDGSEFPVSIGLNPTEIEGEVFIVASIQDLTQIEEESIKLEQSQKLEALGEMVSGIAHNFNNVIAGISGQAYLLKHKEQLSGKGVARIESIESLCMQAADIIKQLLVYAHAHDDEYHDFDLGETVSEIVNIAAITTPREISISHDVENQSLLVFGMRAQIQQTLLNLINNSVHAIGDNSGSVSVSAKQCTGVKCSIKQCDLNKNEKPSFVCLQVQDTGAGISQKHINRIFDPFFTTKALGQGTGLGLSTSYGFIKKHGGHISVSSELGKGTLFRIYLPMAKTESVGVFPPSIITPAITGKNAVVLIIDDDQAIRGMLAEILTGFEYTTLIAEDGESGVALFRQHQSTINLVISDVAMPRLNGREVMAEIRDIKDDIPFLFITDYQDSSIVDAAHDEKTKTIMKPFDFVKLSHQIQELIQ